MWNGPRSRYWTCGDMWGPVGVPQHLPATRTPAQPRVHHATSQSIPPQTPRTRARTQPPTHHAHTHAPSPPPPPPAHLCTAILSPKAHQPGKAVYGCRAAPDLARMAPWGSPMGPTQRSAPTSRRAAGWPQCLATLTLNPSTHSRPIGLCATSLPASPLLASPRITSPHLTSPHLTLPYLPSPHPTSPHLILSHLTSPHLTLA